VFDLLLVILLAVFLILLRVNLSDAYNSKRPDSRFSIVRPLCKPLFELFVYPQAVEEHI
jgi:hypothetical protein